MKELALHRMPLAEGAVLETGCVYIVPLQESLKLPKGVAAAANPKSSTGRLDIFTRVITDYAQEFDKVPEGYEGPLYAEISPRTFPILVREGSRLSQIRFRQGASLATDALIRELHAKEGLISSGEVNIDNGLALSVDLSTLGADGPVGFRAKRHAGLVDVDRKGGARCARLLGADLAARLAGARPRPVLHPRLQGGGARAAGIRRRDGAVQPAGGRVPRALRRLLRPRLRPFVRPRRRCARGAGGAGATRCPSSSRTGRSSAASSMSR